VGAFDVGVAFVGEQKIELYLGVIDWIIVDYFA